MYCENYHSHIVNYGYCDYCLYLKIKLCYSTWRYQISKYNSTDTTGFIELEAQLKAQITCTSTVTQNMIFELHKEKIDMIWYLYKIIDNRFKCAPWTSFTN